MTTHVMLQTEHKSLAPKLVDQLCDVISGQVDDLWGHVIVGVAGTDEK